MKLSKIRFQLVAVMLFIFILLPLGTEADEPNRNSTDFTPVSNELSTLSQNEGWTNKVINTAMSYVLAEHHYVMGGHGQLGNANPYHYVTSKVNNYCHTYPNRGLCTQHRHFDCVGMVWVAFNEAGFGNKLLNHEPWTVHHLLGQWESNHPDRVHYDYNWTGREAGDVVIAIYPNSGDGHVGILATKDTVINSRGGYCHNPSGCGQDSGPTVSSLSAFQPNFRAYLDVELNDDIGTWPPSGGHFPDVPFSNPFFSYIEGLYSIGAVNGFSDGTYRPTNDATRSDAAKIIVLAMGEYLEYTDGQCAFSDVCPGHPFYHYIRRFKELGFTNGFSDGSYRPDLSLVRGDLAKFIVLARRENPYYSSCSPPFSDVPCSHMHYHYIRRLKEVFSQKGVFLGFSDGTYRPDDPITREGTAKLVVVGLDLEHIMPTFYDVLFDNPFYEYVEGIADRGITDGCGSSPPMFCHNESLTRGGAAKFVIRGLGEEPHYNDGYFPFPDVPTNHTFYKYIRRLKELGISRGYSDGTYKPDQYITREAMAKFIVQGLATQGVTCQYNQPIGFSDVPTSNPFYRDIQCLKELDITSGYSDGTFRPSEFITREAASKFIYLAFIQRTPTVPQELSDENNNYCISNAPIYNPWERYALPEGDIDCIQFPVTTLTGADLSAQTNVPYQVTAHNLGLNADLKMEVLAQNGSTVLASATGQGQDGSISLSWTPPSSGNYYIRLSNTNPFAQDGVDAYLTVGKPKSVYLPIITKNSSGSTPNPTPTLTPEPTSTPDPILFEDHFDTNTLSNYQQIGTVSWRSGYNDVSLGNGVPADNKLYKSISYSSNFTVMGRVYIPNSGVGWYDSVAIALRDNTDEYWATLVYGTNLAEKNHISFIKNDIWGNLYPLNLVPDSWYTVKVFVDYDNDQIKMKAWRDGNSEPTSWQTSHIIKEIWRATQIGFRHYGNGTQVDDLIIMQQ